MTLSVGWIKNGHAFIVADSIVTWGDVPTTASLVTSMGEGPAATREAIESVVKVYEIAPNVIGSFMGVGGDGIETMVTLRNRLRLGSSVADELLHLPGPADTCSLLIAEGHAMGASLFVRRNEQWFERYLENHLEVLAPSEKHRVQVECTVPRVVDDDRIAGDPDRLLANVQASLTAEMLRSPQREEGIGGAIFGMHVSSSGIVRSSDILFIMLNQQALPQRAALVGWRGSLAFSLFQEANPVYPLLGMFRCFSTPVNPVTAEEAHQASLSVTRGSVPRYFAFVVAGTGSAVMFEQTPFVQEHFATAAQTAGGFDVRTTDLATTLLERLIAHDSEPHGLRSLHFIATEEDAVRLAVRGWVYPR